MLFCLKNFIFKKWGFVLLFSILFCCKTHFLLFYFLKGIGVNFTLDPPKRKASKKERLQKKKGFKRNLLKKGVSQKAKQLVSEHIIQIHAIKPAVLKLSA